MKKTIACGLIVLILSSIFVMNTYSQEADVDRFVLESKVLSSDEMAEKLVRFHVIANSDEEIDQQVKLKVKDAVLDYMVPKLEVSTSKAETIKIIDENRGDIQSIAMETLHTYNMDNEVSVELNTTFFPTKYYKDFSLPAGDYLALRVIIGNGQGKNWWCVLFPPLCLVDVKTEQAKENEESIKNVQLDNSPIDYDNREELETIDKSNPREDSYQYSPNDTDSKDSNKDTNIKQEMDATKDNNTIDKETHQKEIPYKDRNNREDIRPVESSKDHLLNEKSIDINTTKAKTPKIRWKALELLGFYN